MLDSRAALIPDQLVPILVVSPQPETAEGLCSLLRGSNWCVETTPDQKSAGRLIGSGRYPVAIFDADGIGGEWRAQLESGSVNTSPAVIVASRIADEVMWAEVLNLGGYDVLMVPFEEGEVRWVLYHAWESWKRQPAAGPARKDPGRASDTQSAKNTRAAHS